MALLYFDMLEDAGDGIGLGHFANDTKFPATFWTGRELDTEHTLEPGHPSHRHGGRFACILAWLSARGRSIAGHNEVTVPGVGREQTMISDQMGPRTRHQRGEASDEIVGFEQHVGGAIGERRWCASVASAQHSSAPSPSEIAGSIHSRYRRRHHPEKVYGSGLSFSSSV
jgi:hypothetical protein